MSSLAFDKLLATPTQHNMLSLTPAQRESYRQQLDDAKPWEYRSLSADGFLSNDEKL